ncbi:hypothetical protein WN55_01178 [Dufourea novaeangliae]|uniref:Uncharacterized protein n=1 Tax=Dufourea novaeangliae TaxID=178035 RepID=A0A154PEA0_DUFNO|nr:hypothetical protein WN55_01178 [Dufourea novaeangliae]
MKFKSRYDPIKPRQMEANDEKQARNGDNRAEGSAWHIVDVDASEDLEFRARSHAAALCFAAATKRKGGMMGGTRTPRGRLRFSRVVGPGSSHLSRGYNDYWPGITRHEEEKRRKAENEKPDEPNRIESNDSTGNRPR